MRAWKLQRVEKFKITCYKTFISQKNVSAIKGNFTDAQLQDKTKPPNLTKQNHHQPQIYTTARKKPSNHLHAFPGGSSWGFPNSWDTGSLPHHHSSLRSSWALYTHGRSIFVKRKFQFHLATSPASKSSNLSKSP